MSVINTFGYYSQNKELSLTQNVVKPYVRYKQFFSRLNSRTCWVLQ